MTSDLQELADPAAFNEPLDISGADLPVLKEQLRLMLLIRKAEEKIGDEVTAGNIKCPCHLAIGQEAIPVGVSEHLTPEDGVFGTHRSHGHFLAMGGSIESLFAEILGKSTGCSKGMGGSMHLYDGSKGFLGSVPIVAGTVPLAVGAGLGFALKNKKRSSVGVCYFGDGAIEEGSVHESLNFAQNFKVPVVFVCENNLFSSHLHIDLRQPSDSVARFAQAHRMNYAVIDGNDVRLVSKTAKDLLEKARAGEGPGFLEVVTYRWRGHVGPREDIDVGVKRNEELPKWKGRDPIARLEAALRTKEAFESGEFETMNREVDLQIDRAWKAAVSAPYPDNENLLKMVYQS